MGHRIGKTNDQKKDSSGFFIKLSGIGLIMVLDAVKVSFEHPAERHSGKKRKDCLKNGDQLCFMQQIMSKERDRSTVEKDDSGHCDSCDDGACIKRNAGITFLCAQFAESAGDPLLYHADEKDHGRSCQRIIIHGFTAELASQQDTYEKRKNLCQYRDIDQMESRYKDCFFHGIILIRQCMCAVSVYDKRAGTKKCELNFG